MSDYNDMKDYRRGYEPMGPGRSRKPGIALYVLGGLVIAVTVAAFALFLVTRLMGITDALTQVLVPGRTVLTLDEPGTYTVFHEHRSFYEGRSYTGTDVSDLFCEIGPEDGEGDVELDSVAANMNYSIGSRAGYGIWKFTIQEPGRYVMDCRRDDDSERKAILTVGKGFIKDLLTTIFGGLAIMFAGLTLGVLIIVWNFIRRRKADNVPPAPSY